MRAVSYLLLVSSMLLLTGCTALPERIKAKPVEDGAAPSIVGTNEVLVFGKVTAIVNGVVEQPSWNPFGTGAFIELQKLASLDTTENSPEKPVVVSFETTRNGSYRVVLPAGRYVMTSAWLFGECSIKLHLATDVSSPGHAYYLGEVIADLEAASGFFASDKTCSRLNHLQVTDNFEQARSGLPIRSLDSWAASTKRQLLRRIPGSFTSLATGHSAGGLLPFSGSIRFGR